MENVINVSSKSSTGTLAELVLKDLEYQNHAVLKCIGAGAVNQAVKGIAVATQTEGNLKTRFSFFTVTIDGVEKSGIIMRVEKEEE